MQPSRPYQLSWPCTTTTGRRLACQVTASLILSHSKDICVLSMTRNQIPDERECTLDVAYVLSGPVCRPRGPSDQDGPCRGRRHLAQGRYRRTRAPHPQTRSQLERCKHVNTSQIITMFKPWAKRIFTSSSVPCCNPAGDPGRWGEPPADSVSARHAEHHAFNGFRTALPVVQTLPRQAQGSPTHILVIEQIPV